MPSRRVLLLAAAVALTFGAGGAAHATQPGTNGVLVFDHQGSGAVAISSVAADGSDRMKLTRGPGVHTEAAVSPDGRKIAYAAAAGNKPFEIYVANVDGSSPRRLTRHKRFANSPTWSPDSKRIAYVTEVGPQPKDEGDPSPPLRLHVIGADGSGGRRLVNSGGAGVSDVDPVFTPDGKRVVFGRIKPAEPFSKFDASLATVSSDGGKVRRLTPAGGPDELNPSVSPDGDKIAYEVAKRFTLKQSDIAVMTIAGKPIRRLTDTPVHETNPVWSPDGTRIALTSDRDNRNVSKDRLGRGFELYTMSAEGGDFKRLTDNKQRDLFPDWQAVPAG